MNRPSEQYFKREEAMRIAKELYVDTGEEADLGTAFARYMKEFPVEQFPLRVSTKDKVYNPRPIISETVRPKCPECGKGMRLWEVNTNKQNVVGGKFKTQWICPDEKNCGYQDEYSLLSIKEQIAMVDLDNTVNNALPDCMKVERLSEKYDTPICPVCGAKPDMAVLNDKLTIWVCNVCPFKSRIMQIPLSRWIEKLERGNKGVINGNSTR